jgi:hypothetical protein
VIVYLWAIEHPIWGKEIQEKVQERIRRERNPLEYFRNNSKWFSDTYAKEVQASYADDEF